MSASPSPQKAPIRHQGELLKYVTVFGWQKRYIVLYDHKIIIKMRQTLGRIGSFALNRHCIAADSPDREFCFYIRDTLHNTSISLAAQDMATKEAWMDTIQGVLRMLRLKHLAEKSKTGISPSAPGYSTPAANGSHKSVNSAESMAENAAEFQARHIIYVRVLRALNLIQNDEKSGRDHGHGHVSGSTKDGAAGAASEKERHISVYVRVTIGASTAKTITRKGTAQDLEWGMMFSFAWDSTVRFGTVEVFETTVSADTLVGTALIPVFNCFDGDKHTLALPLHRTSKSQRNISCGSIELELLCTGSPYKGQLVWKFLKEVQVLPEIMTTLIAPSVLNHKEEQSYVIEDEKSDIFHTRHRHSLHEYQSSGVLDDVKAALAMSAKAASTDGLQTPSPIAVRTPAKSAMAAALDLSITPTSPVPNVMLQAPTPVDNAESMFVDVATPVRRGSTGTIVTRGSASRSHHTHSTKTPAKVTEDSPSYLFETTEMDAIRDADAYNEDLDEQLLEGEEDLGNDGDAFLASKGFPFCYPSAEIENIEDFCMRADFESPMKNNEMAIRGVLMLTNFRLIFVSAARIFSEDESTWQEFSSIDLTTYVPIASITKIEVTNDYFTLPGGGQGTRERLKLQTSDCRTLIFAFTDIDIPYEKLQNRAMHLIRQCCTHSYAGVSKDAQHRTIGGEKFDTCITELGKLWSQIHKVGSYIIDGCGSVEGSVCKRIYRRIHMRCMNRPTEHEHYIGVHGKILALVRSVVAVIPQKMTLRMWNMTDEERYQLLKAESDILAKFQSLKGIVNDNIIPSNNPVESTATPTETDTFNRVVAMMREEGSLDAMGKNLLASSLETRLALRSMLCSAWEIYNPLNEFLRMGIPSKHWRMSKANSNYELCGTYPAVLVVPTAVDDITLKEAANFRSMNRVPNMVWRSTLNGSTISRCSQPLVGLGGGRNAADEALINKIHEASNLDEMSSILDNISSTRHDVTMTPLTAAGWLGGTPAPPTAPRTTIKPSKKRPYIILDCRPLMNARANQAGGKGFENVQNYEDISIQFMDMENIHVVRQSYDALEALNLSPTGWLAGLNNSGWLKHIRRILIAAVKIVHCVAIEEISVLVHCSDGWDRTPQLTSLGMLMLDPFYRTIKGFIILIEKEWVSFGHKFYDRLGWGSDGTRDDERSPVFLQFLDCVHQCLKQRPQDFEFNEDMLLFIAKHVHTGWFGNFLFNCERDAVRSHCRMSLSMVSVWTCVLGDMDAYRNKNYVVNPGLSIPVATKQNMILWSAYFCSWNNKLWRAAWLADYSHNDFAAETRAEEEDQHVDGSSVHNGEADGDTAIDSTSHWVDDKLVHHCTHCRSMFTFLFRKHHCRSCGNIFCDPCTNQKRSFGVTTQTKKLQRVCIDCAQKLDIIEKNKAFVSSSTDIEENNSTLQREELELPSVPVTPIATNQRQKLFATHSSAPRTTIVHEDEELLNDEDDGQGDEREASDDWGIDIEVFRNGRLSNLNSGRLSISRKT